MRKFAIALLCVMFASSMVLAASGKNSASIKSSTSGANEGQMAIGYFYGSLIGGTQAISFRYCATDMFAVEGLLGFTTNDNLFGGTGGSIFAFGVKSYYIFKRYSSFNFYGTFGMSLGMISPKQGDSQTAFGILGGVGIEYFIVRNLSISSELGLAGSFMKNDNAFGTFGDAMSNFGLRYYFGG